MKAARRGALDRMYLLGWSMLLSVVAVLAIVIGPALLVALALIPTRIGVPLTVWVTGRLRGLADLHRLWAVRVMGKPIPRPYRAYHGSTSAAQFREITSDPATWRDLRWLPVNATVGLILTGLPTFCLVMTCAGIGTLTKRMTDRNGLASNAFPTSAGGQISYLNPVVDQDHRIWLVLVLSVVFLAATCWVIKPAMRAYTALLHLMLAPAHNSRLAHRIEELTQSRTETLDTQSAEIRRIERDLHDGAQARLVSLGMNLGMAEKLLVADPAAALQLLADAKQSTGHALSELRELVRGIQPPILADRGLEGAAQALVLANPLPISLSVDLPSRAPVPVESAVYFALTEVLANVTKHSAATTAWIRIDHRRGGLSVMVADNGMGGANSTPGGGLHGIERRLAAFDGTLAVTSPVGGPTIVTLEVPCELVSGSS